MLSAQGHIATLPYAEIKTVSFVRDFDARAARRRRERRVFHTRPKMEGLWVRPAVPRRRSDGRNDAQQPVATGHYGFTVVPPDPYGNQQRVFVPRAALRSVEVLGVVGSPLTKRKAKAAPKEQIRLFEE